MGCASSAALPFLTNRGNRSGATNLNGKLSNEFNMVNNKLKENGVANLKDINLSDKMKEVVDSTAVQGVIGGVIQTKDDVINQVQGFGEGVAEKVSSVADDVEEKIEATFVKLSNKVGSMEEEVKSKVQSMEEDIKSVLDVGEAVQTEEIDELLNALPSEEEVKTTAKEVEEKAAEEVRAEADN